MTRNKFISLITILGYMPAITSRETPLQYYHEKLPTIHVSDIRVQLKDPPHHVYMFINFVKKVLIK